MQIIDLTVPIGPDTYSPPSVNQPIGIQQYFKEPGFWMVSEITMMLHAGSHVDFTKHYVEDGETAEGVPLERTSGEAVLIDLGQVEPDRDITPKDLDAAAPEIRPGDIVRCLRLGLWDPEKDRLVSFAEARRSRPALAGVD